MTKRSLLKRTELLLQNAQSRTDPICTDCVSASRRMRSYPLNRFLRQQQQRLGTHSTTHRQNSAHNILPWSFAATRLRETSLQQRPIQDGCRLLTEQRHKTKPPESNGCDVTERVGSQHHCAPKFEHVSNT